MGYTTTRPSTGKLQARQAPETMGAVTTHVMAFATKEDPDAPITVARILRSQASHRLQGWRIALGAHRAVGQC